jgi:hypothetical protein
MVRLCEREAENAPVGLIPLLLGDQTVLGVSAGDLARVPAGERGRKKEIVSADQLFATSEPTHFLNSAVKGSSFKKTQLSRGRAQAGQRLKVLRTGE